MVWIQTYTGEAFTPLAPKTQTIHILDIAHALSMICRFNGHCRKFYSVAEHCVRMSEEIAPSVAIHAIMHDAAEAYISDVARPIKPLLGGYKGIEKGIMDAVNLRFGLQYELGDEQAIKTADLRMLATERQQLMSIHAPKWDCLEGIDPYPITLACWAPSMAEGMFLDRFKELHGSTLLA